VLVVRAEAELYRRSPQRSPDYVGGYRLLGCLADGVTGTSYLAASDRAEFGECLVMANRIRAVGRRVSELGKAFRGEALLATQIDHPNAVRTLGVIQQKDSCYWITEYLDGQPFSKLVRTSRLTPHVSLRARLSVIREALGGLHSAHQVRDQYGRCLKLVHGGMRPSNVIVTYAGGVKVVGFGVARALATHTDWRDIPGRLRYLAPEQVRDEELDRRADIFAVGVMLWESISLRKFASNATQERTAIERRVTGAEPRIAQVSPQVPAALARICDKAMHVDRKERFQTAREFQEALDEYMTSSGAPYKASSLGQLVAKKFEAERTAVHRLIARELREREEPNTAVEIRRPRPDDDDGETTVICDATQLIEESRVTRGKLTAVPPESKHATRRRSVSARWLWAVLGVALLMTSSWALWLAYTLASN
jgi:hypothetical protein